VRRLRLMLCWAIGAWYPVLAQEAAPCSKYALGPLDQIAVRGLNGEQSIGVARDENRRHEDCTDE